MNNYIIVDAHCDTVLKMDEMGCGISANAFDFNLREALSFGGFVQFFAVWVDKKKYGRAAFDRATALVHRLRSEFKENDNCIKQVLSCEDLDELFETPLGNPPIAAAATPSVNCVDTSLNEGGCSFDKGDGARAGTETRPYNPTSNLQPPTSKLHALIALEGADALEGKIENLQHFYDLGVRCMSLTWNHKNAFACGASCRIDRGLTESGRELVGEMNRLGIMVDVSHLSQKSFWDVLECSTAPVIASHSCSDAVCRHRRNLTDEQFKALVQKGGVVGVNFYSKFLSHKKQAFVEDILAHIEHFLSLGGENAIGIGTDFDGASSYPRGAETTEGIHRVLKGLGRMGYSAEIVNKIASGNMLKVMNSVL